MKFFDSLDVHDGRAVNAEKPIRIQAGEQVVQTPAIEVCLGADVQLHVHAGSFHPINLVYGQKGRPLVLLQNKMVEPTSGPEESSRGEPDLFQRAPRQAPVNPRLGVDRPKLA